MSTLIDALKKNLDAMETCSEPEVICYAEEIREIIAEHERSGDWLPIGSCPDDGETEVLLWQDGLGSAEIGTYDTVEFYRRNGMAFVDTPTHWQPLPKGPQP